MILPTSYLTKTNDFKEIMDAIILAPVPQYFDFQFLSQLGYDDPNNKNYVPLFKSLKLIHGNKVPTEAYKNIQHPIRGKEVLAERIKDSYSSVFKEREDAQNLSAREAQVVFRKICPSDSERVIKLKSRTFRYFCEYASWSARYPLSENANISDDSMSLLRQMLNYFNTYLKYLAKPCYHQKMIKSERLAKLPPGNEYELQHYMYNYLKPVFRNIRAESAIDGGYVPDFSISNLNACIEVKYTNRNSNITRLTRDVASSIVLYKRFKYLYFYIYDTQRLIRDPHSFKIEFESVQNDLQSVQIIIIQDV